MKKNTIIILILFTIFISCKPDKIDPKLTINIYPEGTGNVVMKIDQFRYTLVALPEKGYMFNNWSEGASGGNNPYHFVLDFDKTITANFVQTVYDDFEENDGTFSNLHDWITGGDSPPVVQQDNIYDGNWGAEFGDIDNEQNSFFEIVTDFDKAIPLSFMYKVSTEEGFDIFEFSVNGEVWLLESGEKEWKLYESTNLLPPGKNILRWEYKKDSSSSSGDDTVYIDGIGISEATNSMLNINWTIPKGAEPNLIEIENKSDKNRNNTYDKPIYTEDQLNSINMSSIIVRFKEGIRITNKNNDVLEKYTKYGDISYNPINTKFNIATVKPLYKENINWNEILDYYNSLPEVEYAEPNPIINGQEFIPDDPDFNLQWNMNLLNMTEVWEKTLGDSNVTVAVLDSGVTPGLSDSPVNIDTANDYDFVNNDNDANDDYYHGTHVAGTVAQATNNGIGVTGMAPNVTILPVKVLNNSNGGTYSGVTNGIIYATDNGADIINMSLRGQVYNQTMADACQYAYDNNVTIFAATGNDSIDTIGFPAAFDHVIAVGAIDNDKVKTKYSNWGPEIDIVAPGGVSWPTEEGILQQINDGSFIYKNGTSMATPHASGLAAILKSADISLTNDEIENIIKLTTENLGKEGWDSEYGYGLINPLPALNFVIGEGEDITKSVMVKIKENSDEVSWGILSIEGEISIEIYFINEVMNIDLFLYAPNGNLVASSESQEDYESLYYNATDKGIYIITMTKSK